MQEFNSCEISSRISGNLQKDLVLRNQSSHWQHTTPFCNLPCTPRLEDTLLCRAEDQLLLPLSFCQMCLLPSLATAQRPAHGSTATFSKAVTRPWHRIPLPWSLVSHLPHTSAALDGGHFQCFYPFPHIPVRSI